MSAPSVVDLASLVVAITALVVAGVAWRRSDRNTSAGTLIAIFEAFRQGWERFLSETDTTKRNNHFHDLMNLFEVGSAIHQDQSVHGASRELLEDYMRDTLTLIAKNASARTQIAQMRNTPDVFKYLKKFLRAMRLRGHPHFIEPLVNSDGPQPPIPLDETESHKTNSPAHALPDEILKMARSTVDVYGVDRGTGARDSVPAVSEFPVDEALGTTWEQLFVEARKLRPVDKYDLDLEIKVGS